MIRRERKFNLFAATITLEKELSALRGRALSDRVTRFDEAFPTPADRCELENEESFPTIEWFENDDIIQSNSYSEECGHFRKRRKISEGMVSFKKRKTSGLIRSMCMKSQLFMLEKECSSCESPSSPTSVINISKFDLEELLRITTVEALVNVVA
jgi:hypothetical protein